MPISNKALSQLNAVDTFIELAKECAITDKRMSALSTSIRANAEKLIEGGFTIENIKTAPTKADDTNKDIVAVVNNVIRTNYLNASERKLLDADKKGMDKDKKEKRRKIETSISGKRRSLARVFETAYKLAGVIEVEQKQDNDKTDLLRLQGMLTRAQELLAKEKIDGSISSRQRAEINKQLQVAFDITINN